MKRTLLLPVFALLVLSAACGARGGGPRERFRAEVLPVLEGQCGAPVCHGETADLRRAGARYSEGAFVFPVDSDGRSTDLEAAYASARAHVNVVEPEFSSLLRKPLAAELGGLPHFGGASFWSTDDPDWNAILRWIRAEEAGGEDPIPLSLNEQLFADRVQPFLVEANCMTDVCHGNARGGTPFALDPGMAGRVDVTATRENYLEALREVALDGFPLRSRLILKSVPTWSGGIAHRGVEMDFFDGSPGDPLDALVDWICAERESRAGAPCATDEDPPARGVVFVRGEPSESDPFDLDQYAPGTDIWFLPLLGSAGVPGPARNLTGRLHEGHGDARDPAVSRDGARIAFAFRPDAASPHRLVEMELESGLLVERTAGAGSGLGGMLLTDRDPTWGPSGSLWFVSTRPGELDETGLRANSEIFSVGPDGELRRWTYTPSVERLPTFFDLGPESSGELGFTATRSLFPDRARAHSFRFPTDLSSEYHQHFGIHAPETLFFDTRELPDGRYVSVVGELDAGTAFGALAVIDRNLGPALLGGESGDAALAEYIPPYAILRTADGATPLCGDPAPLPDGRILASCHPPSSGGDPDFLTARIELLTLRERPGGLGPEIESRVILAEEVGVWLTNPEPIAIRAPVFAPEPGPLPETAMGADALLVHNGLAIPDMLLARLAPSGAREIRDDFRFLRLIEALPCRPGEREPVAASPDTPHATSTGIGRFGPQRILAELPLAQDGSVSARIPAGVPFRMQGLNENRMAIGSPLDRWFYALPGQTLQFGVSSELGTDLYDAQCSSCHGAADGRGGAPAPSIDPDTVTTATVTLSRFSARDPRFPMDPARVDDDSSVRVDFRRDVQPVLEAHCTACHDGASPAGGLSLSGAPTEVFTESYESLVGRGRLVDLSTGTARRSPLAELLLGVELDAPGTPACVGTPHPPGRTLPESALLTLTRWMDLGAPFVGELP